MDYELIRTKRKTIGIQVKEGNLIIRAPYFVSKEEIETILYKHKNWIHKQLEGEKIQKEISPLTKDEIQKLMEEAKNLIPQRVAFYAEKMGVSYNRITVRKQKTRWGSCSSKGNLNFNCLLMLTPKEVIDSVVVHELCHLKEMNHSKKFYKEVLKVYPDYWKWNHWLKENEKYLIYR